MPRTTKNPVEVYRSRDLAILRFVASYTVVIIEAVSTVIGGGKGLGHIMRRLADEGLLQSLPRALEGGISVYQLSELGAQRIHAPKERTLPLGTQALDKALIVLMWCSLSDVRSYRIEKAEAEECLPGVKFASNHVHAVANNAGIPVIYRLCLVQGGSNDVIQGTRREIESAEGEFRKAILEKAYGFVLLVDSEAKRRSLEAAVARSGIRDLAVVRVELSATAGTVAMWLRNKRRKNQS